MNLQPLKKINGQSYELQKTIEYSQEFVAQLLVLNFLKGNLLDIALTTTATAYPHGLGTTPQGFIIFDKNANADIWRTAWDDRTITLDASATVNAKVWVF
jgi:hypothetical protein